MAGIHTPEERTVIRLLLIALLIAGAARADDPGEPSPLRPAPKDLLLDEPAGFKGYKAPTGFQCEAQKYDGATFAFGLDGKPAAAAIKPPVKGLPGHASLGPDGWLYVVTGAGDHSAEGKDGSKASVLRTGAVFRCRPDGSRLHVFAVGLHDPGMPAFDLGGNLFVHDAGVPSGGAFASGRLLHVVEGGDYGFRLGQGETISNPDTHRAAWLGDRPGTLGPMLKTGRGPAGPLFIYNDSRLPERFRGLLLHPDAAGRRVRAYRLEASGATFNVAEEFEILFAKDEEFKPAQAGVGADGALYVLDRGHGGRLLRLTWGGTKDEEAIKPHAMDTWAKAAKLEDDELAKELGNEDAGTREVVRRELVRRGDKQAVAVRKYFASTEATLPGQLAAMGVLSAMPDAATLRLMARAAEIGEPEMRSLSASLLGLCAAKGDKDANNTLLKCLADEDNHAKRAVALAMARVAGLGAADNIASALSFDNGKDVVLTLGLVEALERLGKPGVDALIALADSGSQKNIDKVAELYPGLRSAEAFAALPGMLRNPHFVAAQRAALVKSAANYLSVGGVKLDAAAKQVIDNPKEVDSVREALLEALAVPGVTAGEKAVAWALARLESENEAERIRAAGAVANLKPAKGGEALLARLAKAAGEEKAALARALAAFPGDKATEALTALVDDKDAGPAALLALPPGKVVTLARKWLGAKDEARQKAAVVSLARVPSMACELAGLILKGEIAAYRADVLAALRRHAAKDEKAAKLMRELSR